MKDESNKFCSVVIEKQSGRQVGRTTRLLMKAIEDARICKVVFIAYDKSSADMTVERVKSFIYPWNNSLMKDNLYISYQGDPDLDLNQFDIIIFDDYKTQDVLSLFEKEENK